MSPEKKRDFEAEWPLLARRLRHFLARKKVSPSQQDDLIQETALRLYKMWDSVDRTRPAWALTVTIALNLLRDEYRRAAHADVVAELPELAHSCDVERAGIARVELARVRDALAEMTPAHRAVLLAEVGQVLPGGVDAGEKMRRMRARRKLTAILERVSAVIFMPVKRLTDLVQAAIIARDPLMAGTSCVLCTMLGLGVAVSVPLAPSQAQANTRVIAEVPVVGLPGELTPDRDLDRAIHALASSAATKSISMDVPTAVRTRSKQRSQAGKGDSVAGTGLGLPSAGSNPVAGAPIPGGGGQVAPPSLPSLPSGSTATVAEPEAPEAPEAPGVAAPEVTPPGNNRGESVMQPVEDVEAVVEDVAQSVVDI